ncbi:hypothetical protein CC80DRAFT_537159 [Byssothecium circinans]|uniref:Uncharacterized protein n=1 Tax=Byssothecium circinans TaxID=147558 RepID=A0A6A5TPJ9_9PLEO|nr:hypothetical protein CC80DRAFT_537159 [Byssothecium circinans]
MSPSKAQLAESKKRTRNRDSMDVAYKPPSRLKRMRLEEPEMKLRRSPRFAPFPFFKLSQEIRDMIYDEIWNDAPALQLQAGTLTKPDRGQVIKQQPLSQGRPGTQLGLPQWLLASQAMMHEGLEQLCFRGQWNVDITTKQPLPPITTKHFPRSLCFTGLRYKEPSTAPKHRDAKHINLQLDASLEDMRKIYTNNEAAQKVTRLTLHILVEYKQLLGRPDAYRLDIKPLGFLSDSFPNLQKLEIFYRLKYDSRYTTNAALEVLKRNRGTAVAHLASMIGGKDRYWRALGVRRRKERKGRRSVRSWARFTFDNLAPTRPEGYPARMAEVLSWSTPEFTNTRFVAEKGTAVRRFRASINPS